MKTFALVITALALCSVSFAQIPGFPRVQQSTDFTQAEPEIPDSATSCAFTFTSGKNNTFLKYCVSGNGNILSVETPQGHPQMSADKREGYGICDSFSNVNYTDFGGGGDSGNWGPAKVVSHSATSVKIARTTSDGIWTMTQTINQASGNTPNVKITMALKNNSSDQRFAVLSRYANVDADGNPLNELDATINSAFAYNSFLSQDGEGPTDLCCKPQATRPSYREASC